MPGRPPKSILELAALALASFSVLGSQIAMTRILSLKYAANQTFLVVSFAVLGLAFGAAIAHRVRGDERVENLLPGGGMLLFAGATGLLLASFYGPFAAMQQIVLVPLPFIGVGACIATIFAERSSRAGFYYAVDLGGAAIGAYAAAPILDVVPAPTAMLVFAATGIVSAGLFWRGRTLVSGIGVVAGLLVAAALLGGGLPSSWRIPVSEDRIKDMSVYLRTARQEDALDPGSWPFIEDSRWSAFGRTDVVNDVARNQKKILFVDGGAGSPMYAAPDRLDANTRFYLENIFGPSLVLRMTPAERKRTVLAIGSGGGRDVTACRLTGVGRVTAVELNADVVAVVRDEAEFNGGLYTDAPDVEVVVEEGRHFLRSSDERYDVILMSIPVTKRGEGYGGFALSESYLFTHESIGEYLDHLEDDGRIIVVCHTRQEVGRLLNTYLEAVAERGLGSVEAMARVAVFGALDPADGLITVLITAQPQPNAFWRRFEAETRRLRMAVPDRLFYFVPGNAPGTAVADASPVLAALATGAAPRVAFPRMSDSTYEPDMSPVNDDRPFFYFFTERLPPLVRTVLIASGLVLLLMVGAGVMAGGAAGGVTRGEQLLWCLGVAGLGVGFMLVEIPLIQRFVFWFGRPTLALGLLLGTLLVSTGLGSLLAGVFVRGRLSRTWPLVAALGVFCMFGFMPAQRALFAAADGSFGDALARSLAITLPLGLLMGVPFPMLLTGAGRRAGVSVAWLWGINGVGSVVGSAGAIALAMLFGYSTALALAGAVYVLTAVVILLLARSARAP